MTTVSFNTSAKTNALQGRSKLRVANRDGMLRFRPTDRKAGANLPKGEKLIDISGGKAALPDGFDAKPGKYALHVDKYGWLALQPHDGGRGPVAQIG
jgi:hypothetical protein